MMAACPGLGRIKPDHGSEQAKAKRGDRSHWCLVFQAGEYRASMVAAVSNRAIRLMHDGTRPHGPAVLRGADELQGYEEDDAAII
jgi:hypothetical protein